MSERVESCKEFGRRIVKCQIELRAVMSLIGEL